MTKVGSGRQQKWAVDYNKSGQRTTMIVGGRIRIKKGGEDEYFYYLILKLLTKIKAIETHSLDWYSKG
jgi:hypothetical protein